MKKQNGFISSSSTNITSYGAVRVKSTSKSYSAWASTGKEVYDHTEVTKWTTHDSGSPYSVMTQSYNSYNSIQEFSWNTYESTCYERIEYFLEAVEKLGEPYSKDGYYYQRFSNYSPDVATESIYNGFVDLVITLPSELRLAGIELINPWISDRFDSEHADYWRYLPTKFNIYKVNTENIRSGDIVNITYDGDIANTTNVSNEKSLRAIKFSKLNSDENLTLLGSYNNINWKNLSNYQCFFKYNKDDIYSKNSSLNSNSVGTATWKCKQLVIRIFETKVKLNHLNMKDPSFSIKDLTYIKKLLCEYILAKELEYGTTYLGDTPSIEKIFTLIRKRRNII